MKHESSMVTCQIEFDPEAHHQRARVCIPQPVVAALYKQALDLHQRQVQARGFGKGAVPIAYLERTYRAFIIEHMKEFLLNHCVINTLCDQMCQEHLLCIGDPLIESIYVEPEEAAEFIFSLNQSKIQEKTAWKKVSFHPPKRRNYKDIDKQVETFIENECKPNQSDTTSKKAQIAAGDWVLFSLALVDLQKDTKLLNHDDQLWLRMGTEEPDYEAVELFSGKSVGESFISDHIFFQQYLSKQWDSEYHYLVTIKDHISSSHIPTEYLTRLFFCKNNNDLKELCVQMFSFRQDLSLRREMVASLFKTLQKHIQTSIPKDLISQQERYVLREVQRTPDYPVYRLQKDFREKIRQLAEKQLYESIIVDYIAAQEKLVAEHEDVTAYLALHVHPRTKDMLNFHLPITQVNGQEQPIPANMVRLACLREKALNYILHMLAYTA